MFCIASCTTFRIVEILQIFTLFLPTCKTCWFTLRAMSRLNFKLNYYVLKSEQFWSGSTVQKHMLSKKRLRYITIIWINNFTALRQSFKIHVFNFGPNFKHLFKWKLEYSCILEVQEILCIMIIYSYIISLTDV